MDNQQIPIELFNSSLSSIFIYLGLAVLIVLMTAIFTKKFRGEVLELTMYYLKFLGYGALAFGAYYLTYDGSHIVMHAPESLSLSQCFVILLAIFESVSSLISIVNFYFNSRK